MRSEKTILIMIALVAAGIVLNSLLSGMLMPGTMIHGKLAGPPGHGAAIRLKLNVDAIDFANLDNGQEETTADYDPNPFELENNGKSMVDVDIKGSDIWEEEPNPSEHYQFQSAEKEPGSVNDPLRDLVNEWTGLSDSPAKFATNFKPRKKTDELYGHIRILVPLDEGAGEKSSTLTFIGYASE